VWLHSVLSYLSFYLFLSIWPAQYNARSCRQIILQCFALSVIIVKISIAFIVVIACLTSVWMCVCLLAGLLCDLLWSDPDKDVQGWGENDRGVSFTFGADVVSKFLNRHDLDLICRAHQVTHDCSIAAVY